MPAAKKMTKEEYKIVMTGKHNQIREASEVLAKLANLIGPGAASDFNFGTLESVDKALEAIGMLNKDLREVRNACALRGKTKVAEVCKTT